MANNYRGISTPWGQSDAERELAEGIITYSTPRHGGIHLSQERYAQLPAAFRGTEFGGHTRWFEEDCDIVKVAVIFPEAFPLAGDWTYTLTAFERYFPSLVPALLAHYKVTSRSDVAAICQRAATPVTV